MSVFSKMFSGGAKSNALKITIPVVILGVLFTQNYIFSDSQESVIPSINVKRGDVAIKITEAGELRASDQVTISAVTDKQILWLVPEGTTVEEGDTLLVYESEKYVISKSEAEVSVELEKANIIRAESDLESQKAKEEGARQKYENLRNLAKDGFAVESEVEQARLGHIELQSKTRGTEASVDAARANLRRAERQLNQQERKLRQGVALAPRAGLVVYAPVGSEEDGKKIEVGMIPFEGMDLIYLPDISTMMVDTEISEVDLARVHPGMKSEIRLDAYPDAVFEGEIENIADLAKRKISRITGKATGAKVFEVEVEVDSQDERLKPGLSATVDIIISTYENALYIPLEAVFIDELDRTTVFVKKGGGIEQKVVKLGESNERVILVVDGVKEGDELLLGRPASTT